MKPAPIRLLCLAFVLLSSLSPFCQTVQLEWTRQYTENATSSETSGPSVLDASGNLYTTGSIRHSPSSTDILTVKYNQAGVLQWAVKYDSRPWETGIDIACDAAGNVYVLAHGTASTQTMIVLKYNSNGLLQWSYSYVNPAVPGEQSDGVIAVDPAGGVVFAGRVFDGSFYDLLLVKLSNEGIYQWSTMYSGEGHVYHAKNILFDSNSNIYIGTSDRDYSSNTVFLMMKYSSSGQLLWTSRYGPGNEPIYYSLQNIARDAAGNLYATGSTPSGIVTVKYNSDGVLLWGKEYSFSKTTHATPWAMKVGQSGDVYITGTAAAMTSGSVMVTLKYNTSGVLQWANSYGSLAERTSGQDLTLDQSDQVYVVGRIGIDGRSVTIRYSPAGAEIWATRLAVSPKGNSAQRIHTYRPNTPQVTQPAVLLNGFCNVSPVSEVSYDITVVKYIQPVVSQFMLAPPKVGETPNQVSPVSAYPNPFRDQTLIRYTLTVDSRVLLSVFDQAGRQVSVLVNRDEKAGSYQVNLDGTRLAPGTYLYELKTVSARGESDSQTGRVVRE